MPVEDTWTWRDLPFLEAAVNGVDRRPGFGRNIHEIAAEIGISETDANAAAAALSDAGLISTRTDAETMDVHAVSGQARQLVGSWPSEQTFADRLVATIDAMAEHATTDDERTRLGRLRDALSSAGRDLLVSVAASVISGQIPR